jgi:hypothetical protein
MADTWERHETALAWFRGYCRMMTAAEWLALLEKWEAA